MAFAIHSHKVSEGFLQTGLTKLELAKESQNLEKSQELTNLALKYIRTSAKMMNPKALYFMGRSVFNEEEIKACQCFRLSADIGYAPAQYELAQMYFLGKGGVNINMDRGMELLRKAASQGFDEAVKTISAIELFSVRLKLYI